MQTRNSSLRGTYRAFLAFALLLSFVAVQPVWGQLAIPAEAISNDSQVQGVIQQGTALETDGRWGEALTHYEEALREHPGRQDLKQRLTISRVHFDVGRRYSDHRFVSSLAKMSENDALNAYTEVLLKIKAHYVHSPDWNELLARGTTQLDIALTDDNFRQHRLRGANDDSINKFRHNLRQIMNGRPARDRHDARASVSMAARYTAQQLGIPEATVVMEYTCGAIGALDMYSSFLTGAQLDDVMSQIEGNFVGLGVELKADNDALLIVTVINGGPAQKGGMQSGDRIVMVDGKSMKDMTTDAAADMLKGTEGSSVDLAVVQAGNVTKNMRLVRQRVEVPSVEDIQIVDRDYGIGYLKLASFQKTTLRDFDAALWNLHRQGMRSLIVDVRGNPGGLLTASVEVADKFVSKGTIVSTRGRSAREDFDYKAHETGTWRVPLIVLIDGDSASASEIFAAAIHDHRRGTVIGERSYGKGSVQGIFPLNVARSGVRLTTAKFYSPNGTPISNRGVQPDVVVRTVAKPVADNVEKAEPDDVVLNAGMQVARRQLSQR